MTVQILIVDDLHVNLEYLEKILETLDIDEYNINIIKAQSGEEALAISKTTNIDLAILDINMPNMNGFEVASHFKLEERTKDIIIVFLTAFYDELEFQQYGYSVGAVDYFIKPIEVEKFLNKIKLYLPIVSKNKELVSINETLHEKVKSVIEKNKMQKEQILQQSRLAHIGEMISMLAHQWRQPLAAITMDTMNLKLQLALEHHDLSLEGEREKLKNIFVDKLSDIEKVVFELNKTIDLFSRFYKVSEDVEETTFSKIIENVMGVSQDTLKSNNVKIVYDFGPEETIKVNPHEVMQAVMMIVQNADDNFKENKISNAELKISTIGTSLTICDNGGGIDKNIIDKIFDPYFTTKNALNGTGIGLYISKIIIDNNKGKISVENTNGGACFKIVL